MNGTTYTAERGPDRLDPLTENMMPTFEVIRTKGNLSTVEASYRLESVATAVAGMLQALAEFEV